MHRSIFESLMRTLKGHLLYQAEYLSRLLVKPPPGRSEADVLKLASYLTSLQRFQEVPQPKLVQLAKEVTYAELAVGTLICRQGILFVLSQVYAVSAGFVAASKAHSAAAALLSMHCCLQALLLFASKTNCQGCKAHVLCLSVPGLFPASKIFVVACMSACVLSVQAQPLLLLLLADINCSQMPTPIHEPC